jgi:hypothetical protein
MIGQKAKEWLWRYAPAEIISIPATLVPAWVVYQATHAAISAALAGTWGGNIGYFGTILLRDVWQTRRALLAQGRKYGWETFCRNVRALTIEFGIAEIVDSFLVRPTLMYWLPLILGDLTWGILIAKMVADISFYLPAILFYEMSKERYRKF